MSPLSIGEPGNGEPAMTDRMWFGVITLFPPMLDAVTQFGVSSRAVKQGKLQVVGVNPRDFTHDKHRTVDDRPFGGGPGMVMLAQPLLDAIADAKAKAGGPAKVIYLSPQGQPLTQAKVQALAKQERLILLCGRYEGIDERAIEMAVDEEISIGDYVLSGGELPAMVLIDAVARLLPGVLNDELSAEQDSFTDGLLDCPHYTRPEVFDGRAVPAELMSGHHEQIRRWRLKQSLVRTLDRRPELLQQWTQRVLTKEEKKLLEEVLREQKAATPDGNA